MQTQVISDQTTDLQAQIDEMRMQIRTEGYAMSISEWASLYESSEIDIHPEFQRFFRWTSFQKSRLIESILLGIPIPPIFVSQRPDGVWDVVDGLQRLSTIYEFMGILKDANGVKKPKLILEKPNILTALEGKIWEADSELADSFELAESLTSQQKLIIKRSKIDVNIILRESDVNIKYELFDRLNTGGTQLSPQEVRNSILVMLNPALFENMNELASNNKFKEIISLTDRALEERYDLDLITRFFVFRNIKLESLKGFSQRGSGNFDMNDLLMTQIQEIARDREFNVQETKSAFESTMDLLYATLGSDSLKKYDQSRKKFVGGFTISAFEGIILGIAHHYPNILSVATEELKNRCIHFWSHPDIVRYTGNGIRAAQRVPHTLRIGRDTFKP